MRHTIILPDLGQTTSEAKILKWHKKPGDLLSMGDALVEVETDKATMDVEAYIGGYLRATLVEEGQMATAKEPIAILTDTVDEAYVETEAVPKPAATSGSQTAKAEVPVLQKTGSAVAALPAARTLAKNLGIDLAQVRGTGPNGMITVKDVQGLQGQTGAKASPTPASLPDSGALSAMAAITSSSKTTIPHFYVTVEVDMRAAVAWREQWNAAHPDLTASFNDLFVRAASAAVTNSPQINTALKGGTYQQRSSGDVLLIVAAEGKLNLVPVEDPSRLGWDVFLREIRKTLNAAKAGKVLGKGGTAPLLAISNLGMYHVKEFAAIIPPGCTAVLAIGSVRDQIVLQKGSPTAVKICSLTLSVDHRVADGIAAAKFLERMQVELNSL
ncbi:MAG: dihydrolipoamide acetyltransferase family protein [Terriglobia bacterium]